MLKTAVITTVTALAGIAGCQPAPSKPAPAPKPQAPCVVTYAVNAVPDVPAGCQLNLIFPTFEAAGAYCDGPDKAGERTGYPDTCYDVDY
jgi:hypothetical protein